MPERPIIIRGGLLEPLPDEPTMRGGGSMQTGSSLFVESTEPLDFVSSPDKKKWQLRLTQKVTEIGLKAKSNGRKFNFDSDGTFRVGLNETSHGFGHHDDRHHHDDDRSTSGIVLVIAAAGLVAWLLSRRS